MLAKLFQLITLHETAPVERDLLHLFDRLLCLEFENQDVLGLMVPNPNIFEFMLNQFCGLRSGIGLKAESIAPGGGEMVGHGTGVCSADLGTFVVHLLPVEVVVYEVFVEQEQLLQHSRLTLLLLALLAVGTQKSEVQHLEDRMVEIVDVPDHP